VVAGDSVALWPLANDRDPDGDPVTVDRIGQPRHGTARAGPDGTIVYASSRDRGSGTDAFGYTIRDGRGGTAAATVTIRVVAAEDLPVTGRNVMAVATAGLIVVAAGGALYGLCMRGPRDRRHRA